MKDPVIRGYLVRLVGEEGLEMIEKMPEGEVTDEQISQATGILLNIVRRTLFILNENKLAICRRERDASSGWLTYLWTLDMSDVDKQLVREKRRLLKNLKVRDGFEEENVFYVCPEGCIRMDFKEASEAVFMCSNCGEDMIHQDNSIFLESLRERIKKLET